jgi:hypothetical protein
MSRIARTRGDGMWVHSRARDMDISHQMRGLMPCERLEGGRDVDRVGRSGCNVAERDDALGVDGVRPAVAISVLLAFRSALRKGRSD